MIYHDISFHVIFHVIYHVIYHVISYIHVITCYHMLSHVNPSGLED